MKNANKTFGTLSRMLCAIALTAVILFSMIACGDSGGGNVPQEQLPDSERWWVFNDDSSTAKVEVSVGSDDVCTITVSGGTETYDWWKGMAGYSYTQEQGVSYKYTFEAWTKSGERELKIGYFENNANANDEDKNKEFGFPITTTKQTYTFYGKELPVPGEYPALRFKCANQLGTFYVKIKNIEKYTLVPSTLTITGIPSEYEGKYVLYVDKVQSIYGCQEFINDGTEISLVKIENGSVSLPMWLVNQAAKTATKYTGNDKLLGMLNIFDSATTEEPDEGEPIDLGNITRNSITFSKGGAIIDASTLADYCWYWN